MALRLLRQGTPGRQQGKAGSAVTGARQRRGCSWGPRRTAAAGGRRPAGKGSSEGASPQRRGSPNADRSGAPGGPGPNAAAGHGPAWYRGAIRAPGAARAHPAPRSRTSPGLAPGLAPRPRRSLCRRAPPPPRGLPAAGPAPSPAGAAEQPISGRSALRLALCEWEPGPGVRMRHPLTPACPAGAPSPPSPPPGGSPAPSRGGARAALSGGKGAGTAAVTLTEPGCSFGRGAALA